MIELISEIVPKNNGDFPMVNSDYVKGGCHQAETYDDMLAISSSRLKNGTLCLVTTPVKVLYIYDKDSNTWEPFSSGGGGNGDWLCVEDGETTKLVKNIENWTQKITVINHIRTYADYFALPTEYVQNNEVAYCKADVMEGTTIYKKGLYSYDASKASWVEVNSTIEIDSALSDTSKRPVQNRVVTKALEEKVSKDDVDNVISRFSENPIQNKAVATALENMKNSKTMTAEEYEALDDETKNDGSFYYISDTGEIYQNGIIYGGKQIFDVTQEEYDALADEEKAINEYHCTDTGRIYINGVLYGDKKSIELTFEEYKQLEADGLVEPDVDYVIVSDEKGILLSNIDLEHGTSGITCYEVIEELKSDVTTLNAGVDKKESVYITNDPSGSGILYNAAEYLGVNSVDTYGIYNLVVITDTGESGECNFIYKHRVATYGNIISENGVTFYNLNEYGTVVVNSTSANRTFKVKYLGEPTEDMSGLSKYEYTRANKNALVSDVTSTYLIKDIAAGENEKTVSFKVRKDYFAAYYAKRTFLLSTNVYSLGFSKPVIGLVEIFRGSADNYGGYVVNLQDSRYTGVTVTVNGDYLEIDVTFNSYEGSGCMVSCSSLSNVPIA